MDVDMRAPWAVLGDDGVDVARDSGDGH
jgi:hypothetical protein